MGFLETMKDIGFGNTGRRGFMKSGATNYANYAQQRRGQENERGVTQALAMAAKNGKMVDPKQIASIAEKWDWPYMDVWKRANGINETIDKETLKSEVHKGMQGYFVWKQENPGKEMDQSAMMELTQDLGMNPQYLPRVLGIVKDYAVKMQDEKKMVTHKQGDSVSTIGPNNKVTPLIVGNPTPPTKPMTEAALQERANNPDPAISGPAKKIIAQMHERDMASRRAGTEAANTKLQKGKDQLPPATPTQGKDATVTKETAELGTGFWSKMAAVGDALYGATGFNKLVGKDRIFADIQDARQSLRLLKQTAKSAFMNSGRGPIWEQKKIDGLFPDPDSWIVNPATEAEKLPKLREHLLALKAANDESIRKSIDMKELQKYRAANQQVDQILNAIGTGGGEISDEDLINMYNK